MRKRYAAAILVASALAASQAAGVLAASPDTGVHINTGSDDGDRDLGEALEEYQQQMGLTGTSGSTTTTGSAAGSGSGSAGALSTSTSPRNDVLTVEAGQSVTGQEGSTTVTVDSRGQAVVGDTALELVQGGGATVGLPEAVVNTINGINAGQTLSNVVPGVDLTGYNALTGTHAIMTRVPGTATEKLGSAQTPLYVPNLIDGLGTVQVLYFNNHTGRWELLTPSSIDVASKTLWVTIPGSGTLSVVYRR